MSVKFGKTHGLLLYVTLGVRPDGSHSCVPSLPCSHCILKVKLSLCFNWAPRHEGILGEWRYSSTHSLTSALDWGEWSASRPGLFTPRERALGTHWIGGWVGPIAVLDAVLKRKIPSPRRESNPIVQPVVQRLRLLRIHKGDPSAVVCCLDRRFGRCLCLPL
jgi:hypothetical protein